MALFDDASLVVTPNGYKAGTLYSIKPTSGAGDMTVVRATTATRVNSAGLIESMANNVPRLDYTDSTCPSLLLEKQSTNQYPYSEDLTQWATIGSPTITGNDSISPDGTTNADRVQFSGSGNLVYKSGTGSAGTNVLTVYAKAKTGTAQKFSFFANGTTLISSDFTATDQWQRFEFIYTYSAQTAGLKGASTGASDVLFWGFQHEISSYATSYIPTTTAAVTRNADAISKTGISSLIGQTEGVMFLNINSFQTNVNRYITISDGTSNNYVYFRYIDSSNQIWFRIASNGVVGSVQIYTYTNPQDFIKTAIRYNNNSFDVFLNGVKIITSVGVNTLSGSMNQLKFSYPDNTNIFQGNVKSVQLYKTALTDQECINLTTL